ncbi:MAG: hypothetical protein ACKVVT_10735 [Dehalococcoidia bacterium]
MGIITIDDDLARRAAAEARRRRITVSALIEAALAEELAQEAPEPPGVPRFELPACPVPPDRWGLQVGLEWDALPYLDEGHGTPRW